MIAQQLYFLITGMADADPQFKRLLLPAEETLFEQLLRFGLYVGAVFQIMCLLAIVIYQAGPSDGVAALKVHLSYYCLIIAKNITSLFSYNIMQ